MEAPLFKKSTRNYNVLLQVRYGPRVPAESVYRQESVGDVEWRGAPRLSAHRRSADEEIRKGLQVSL